jgi:hypothetical protein
MRNWEKIASLNCGACSRLRYGTPAGELGSPLSKDKLDGWKAEQIRGGFQGEGGS